MLTRNTVQMQPVFLLYVKIFNKILQKFSLIESEKKLSWKISKFSR